VPEGRQRGPLAADSHLNSSLKPQACQQVLLQASRHTVTAKQIEPLSKQELVAKGSELVPLAADSKPQLFTSASDVKYSTKDLETTFSDPAQHALAACHGIKRITGIQTLKNKGGHPFHLPQIQALPFQQRRQKRQAH